MTKTNENKQRHLHVPLKTLFLYHTKIERGAQSITVERVFKHAIFHSQERGVNERMKQICNL